MKLRAALLVALALVAGCAAPRDVNAPQVAPELIEPRPAAESAKDAVMRPVETGRFAWRIDSVKHCAYPAPGGDEGAWWVHDASTQLPGLDGASLRFCQWRGKTILSRWAVHAVVEQSGRQLYASPRLGDELNWYEVATLPERTGFALVVGLTNHAGQREWMASAQVIPYDRGFREARAMGAGIFGGTMLSPDRTRLIAWHGQHANMMEGVVINCLLCQQHMTVREYTWGEGWEPRPGPERRTRLMYTLGSPNAALEPPVAPRAAEVYQTGMELIREGDLVKARDVLAAAFGLDPTFADAANEMGYTYILREQWAEAIAPLEEALKVDPHHGGARFNLALALTRLGRHKEAREHAIHAVLLQPGREEPRALYEEIRRAMGS